MRVWQILLCVAFVQIASAYAFSFPFSHESYKHEDESYDLEVAASDHKGHSSSFEEAGGSDHGEKHESKVKIIKLIEI
jgi:hypothetical protein